MLVEEWPSISRDDQSAGKVERRGDATTKPSQLNEYHTKDN